MQKLNEIDPAGLAMIAGVDSAKLMEYVENIAQYVRLSGNSDDRKAYAYIKDTLESFGLNAVLE